MTESTAALRRAHDQLLFTCAYPADREAWETANRELHELAVRAQRLARTTRGASLQNSGIAGTPVVASFSLAVTRWLVDRFPGAVFLDSIGSDPDQAMPMLNSLLDPMEQEVLSEQPVGWVGWIRRHLGPVKAGQLPRLLSVLEQLPGDSGQREAVYAALRVYLRWEIPVVGPVPTTGRFRAGEFRFHPQQRWRRLTPRTAWGEGKPAVVSLEPEDRRALVDLARGTMASLLSETDPFTHANPDEIELHDLGQGITVALFACAPAHKLPLEAYIGYLLLKNQVPVAYGGGWVLGRQARFGINVLPPFRGGESTVLLSHLLRLYGWRFGLKLFLVDPYQIGKGNTDGIRSGAFWFYWRLGFRPRQPELLRLARAEARRIKAGGKRTTAATLRKLSHAVMAWETPLRGRWAPIDMEQVGARVSAHVLERFDGNRAAATRRAKRRLGLRDARLAVTLDALAPKGGWSAAEIAALNQLMLDKDHHEMDQARALQKCRQVMDRLAGAAGASQ